MRGTRWITAVVVVGALTCGCGASQEDSGKTAPKASETPLPVAAPSPSGDSPGSMPTLKPSPGSDASFVDNVVYELRRKTVGMAYAMGKTTGECAQKDAKPKAGTKLDCTVTYEGVKVPWSVKIKGEGITPNLVEYDAEPKKGIITREGAIRFYWGNKVYGKNPKVRCTDIPKAAVVPLGKTKYQCESDGLRENLNATTDGPRFY